MDRGSSLRETLEHEASRVGMSLPALIEWIELCGMQRQLQADLAAVEARMDHHRKEHQRPALRLVTV